MAPYGVLQAALGRRLAGRTPVMTIRLLPASENFVCQHVCWR